MLLNSRVSAVIAAAIVAAACTEQSTPAPTSPDLDPRFTKPVSGFCNATFGTQVEDQQKVLYASQTLTDARTRWSHVTAACVSSLSLARDSMLSYVQFTIDAYRGGLAQGSDPAAGTTGIWNPAFQYVFYTAPNLPTAVLTVGTDAVKVVPSGFSTPVELTIATLAAMTVYPQDGTGDNRGHLFAIYEKTTANCLGGTNLATYGPCVDFSANPSDGRFSPPLKVGVCETETFSPASVPAAALAHASNGTTLIHTLDGWGYPSASFCGQTLAQGSWTGGFKNVVRRLAWLAGQTLGVKRAYAVHGGATTLPPAGSPFQLAGRRLLNATFNSDQVGFPPGSPDVGSWQKLSATPPGTILVQSSLGDLTKPVVLSQGGGNCAHCGGLDLWGRLTTTLGTNADTIYATNGRYEVSWKSVQDAPSLKKAPIVGRSSTNAEIFRIEYAQKASTNTLSFNGTVLTVGWVRHVTQKFTLIVNLDTKEVSLDIDGTPYGTKSFNATDFATVRAEFTGIDSGIFGWKNILVERIQDTPAN